MSEQKKVEEALPRIDDSLHSIAKISGTHWDAQFETGPEYRAMVKYRKSGGMGFGVEGLEGPYDLHIELDDDSASLKISRAANPEESRSIAFDPKILALMDENYTLQKTYVQTSARKVTTGYTSSQLEADTRLAKDALTDNEQQGCALIKRAFAEHAIHTENLAGQPFYSLMCKVMGKKFDRDPIQQDIAGIGSEGFANRQYVGTHDDYIKRIQKASVMHITGFHRPYNITIINEPHTDSIMLRFTGSDTQEQCYVQLPKQYWLRIVARRQELVDHYTKMIMEPDKTQAAHDARREHHNATADLLRHCLMHAGIDAPFTDIETDVSRNIVGIMTELLAGEAQIDPDMKEIVRPYGKEITLPETVRIFRKIKQADGEMVKQPLDVPPVNFIYGMGEPVKVSVYSAPKCTLYQFIGKNGDFKITMPEEFNHMLYGSDEACSPDHKKLIEDTFQQAGITTDAPLLEELYALAEAAKPQVTNVTMQGAAHEKIIPGTTARYCA